MAEKTEKKEFKITDLPGVGAATAEKLEEAGFNTLMSIAVASPADMVEIAGVTEATARKIINVARNKLDIGFQTGVELLEKRKNIDRITTGSKAFDTLLAGGVETNGITEVYGEFGCVASDTLITLADGKMQPIGEIAKGLEQGEYELELPVITWFNNSLTKTIARKLFVYNCDSLIKIQLSDGRELKVTPNHPLMTQDGWKRADQLKENEYLIVSWPEVFPDKEVKLINEIKLLTLSKYTPKIIKTKKVKLPEVLNEDLAKFLGYQLGEGWPEKARTLTKRILRVSFASSNKYILDDWKNLVEKVFEIKPNFRKLEKNTETWAIDSVIVGEFLKQFEGLYNKAKTKYIPKQLIESPKNIIAKFLAGLYDAEGYPKLETGKIEKLARWKNKDGVLKEKLYINDKKGKSLELRSSSLNLLQQVQLLLTKFRIRTSITFDYTNGYKCYKLYIYRKENLIRFYDNIGIHTVRIKDKLQKIINNYQRNISIQNLNILLIKSIGIIQNLDGKVYDIEVPNTHSFLANNIVSHNSSKTQLGHQLAVNVQLPKEQGGAGGMACYIDSEGTARPERIKQMAEALNLDPIKILDNIKFIRAFNSDHQMLIISKIEELIKNDKLPIKLVVVDSLMSHFRSEFIGRGTLSERQQKLNKHLHDLLKLSEYYNLVVYVTNQVMANPAIFFGDPTTAIGGNILAHASSVRIYVRKGKKGTRVARIIDSPNLPDSECAFRVTEDGIRDVE